MPYKVEIPVSREHYTNISSQQNGCTKAVDFIINSFRETNAVLFAEQFNFPLTRDDKEKNLFTLKSSSNPAYLVKFTMNGTRVVLREFWCPVKETTSLQIPAMDIDTRLFFRPTPLVGESKTAMTKTTKLWAVSEDGDAEWREVAVPPTHPGLLMKFALQNLGVTAQSFSRVARVPEEQVQEVLAERVLPSPEIIDGFNKIFPKGEETLQSVIKSYQQSQGPF